MASIEEWADRLSKIRRGLDPDQPEMDPEWMKQLGVLDLIRKGRQPILRDGVNLEGRDPVAERQAAAPAGTIEEGRSFAREIPQDQSRSAKVQRAMKIIQNIMGGGGGDESSDVADQGDASGLHDYERQPVQKTYPKGKMGKVLSGVDKGLGIFNSIIGNQPGRASAEDYALVEEGNQESRGVGNILGNLRRIGSRKRVGEEQLTHAREDRQIANDLKRSQAEQARGRGTYYAGKTAIDQDKNDIQRIRAQAYSVKTVEDSKRLRAELEVKKQNSETRMGELEVAMRNATSTEERDRLMDIHRQEEQTHRDAEDLQDHLEEKERAADRRGNLNVNRARLDIEQQKLPGDLAQQRATTNKVVRESAEIGTTSKRLLDQTRGAAKERKQKEIMDKYRFNLFSQDADENESLAREALDALDRQYGEESESLFGVPAYETPTPPPSVYEGDNSNYPARSRSSKGPASRTDNEPVTFIDADGNEKVLTPAEAKRVEALIRSGQMKGWRKR